MFNDLHEFVDRIRSSFSISLHIMKIMTVRNSYIDCQVIFTFAHAKLENIHIVLSILYQKLFYHGFKLSYFVNRCVCIKVESDNIDHILGFGKIYNFHLC
eukprot:NODE_109_length_18665_cov_0.924486.p22 type:complete len:100 gc:universal NODE_109_length_18665_cov_0.924486:17599-17300(-)